ncbi:MULTISPECIES: DUF6993 domain-containing protein [Microbacterium]|uniref:DUF6993 domain-containing protein n=1 Tax=Microbacterium TaxID=33882 RepID=UPI001EF02084|nr:MULTISPECIES: hypothetical protein [Microbacterium]UIN32082.1 hypothetical protein LXM64_07835 [Microbacterium binotii]
MTPPRAVRLSALVLVAAAGSVVLAACTPSPEPSPTVSVSTPIATTPAPSPAPTLVPEGSAEDNLPLFTSVVDAVWAGPDQVAGRAYIDALTAAGFDKAAMQVTPDQSTVNNPAESIQFSVRWGDECLIGQVGPATREAVTVVEPILSDGTCLIGRTRAIDW